MKMLCYRCILLTMSIFSFVKSQDKSIILNDSNWNEINTGEWLVKLLVSVK